MEERLNEAVEYCEEEIERIKGWMNTPSWDDYDECCIEASASKRTCEAILKILKGA